MISLDKVEESILELERGDTCFSVCEKLASLYTVRDHLRGYQAAAPAAIDLDGSSDFLRAVNGKNPEAVLPIIDGLMDAVRVLHPGMYDSVMDKISEL